jgi:multidrug transporter EmrE-like cation transporter
VTFLAVILIHEQLSVIGISGISLVVFGIYVIHLQSFSRQSFYNLFPGSHFSSRFWLCVVGPRCGRCRLVGAILITMGVVFIGLST